jgi:adenosylmethionine-8-amino-7-oxononanoate aminotransferase
MDECVTGFRWAIGGASEYFGIEPDLAVFGKGMANGYPLACVVGPRDTLSHAVDCSGTFGGEAVSLAACRATLGVYREHDVIGHMASVGQEWISSGEATGYPCHPRLTGSKEEVFRKAGILAREGVLVHPAGFNVSYSHTKKQAQEAIRVLQAARVSPLP